MVLYGKGQSRSFRVLWALEEVNLPFEYKEIDIGRGGANGSLGKEYKMLNIQGKVPSLVDGELVITESAAILNYIGGKNPEAGLIPLNDLVFRTLYDQICFFVLSELEQPLWTRGKHKFAIPEEHRVPAILETAKWEFRKALGALDSYLKGKDFVVENRFSMADILVAHTLNWAERFKFEVPQEYLAYRDKMYDRPACKRASAFSCWCVTAMLSEPSSCSRH